MRIHIFSANVALDADAACVQHLSDFAAPRSFLPSVVLLTPESLHFAALEMLVLITAC